MCAALGAISRTRPHVSAPQSHTFSAVLPVCRQIIQSLKNSDAILTPLLRMFFYLTVKMQNTAETSTRVRDTACEATPHFSSLATKSPSSSAQKHAVSGAFFIQSPACSVLGARQQRPHKRAATDAGSAICLLGLISSAWPADLFGTYQQALAWNPTYAPAHASRAETQERIPKRVPACCRSLLRERQRSTDRAAALGPSDDNFGSGSETLSVAQPIYRRATALAYEQALTHQAYFGVLLAKDSVAFAKGESVRSRSSWNRLSAIPARDGDHSGHARSTGAMCVGSGVLNVNFGPKGESGGALRSISFSSVPLRSSTSFRVGLARGEISRDPSYDTYKRLFCVRAARAGLC